MKELKEAIEIHSAAVDIERERWTTALKKLIAEVRQESPGDSWQEYSDPWQESPFEMYYHDGQCDVLERLELIIEEIEGE